MATFVTLLNFTEQGARNIKETPHRAEAFTALAKKMGVEVKSLHWTIGQYDLVCVTEGSDEGLLATLFATASLGNVRTQTLRAFNATEIKKIIGQMP
jgi:uncharacterized protein with GYD domain